MRQPNRELEKSLSRKRLREVLHYDPKTGVFTWARTSSNRAIEGKEAGCYNQRKNGTRYVIISVDRCLFTAHRLAWFYMRNEWPELEIDHADGDGWNNRWSNLREATASQNQQNAKLRTDNSTGVKGVTFNARYKNPYLVWLNGKYLGSFANLGDAKAHREVLARTTHGAFYREQ